MSAKMKKCKHCGAEIAKSAKVCPTCGGKNGGKGLKIFLGIFVALIVIGALGSLGDSDSDEPAPTTEPQQQEEKEQIEYTQVTVSEMMDLLKSNAMKAENTYDDAYLEVTGRLSIIDSDGKYFSLFSSQYDILGVQCFIKGEEQKNALMDMEIGDTVTVRGKISDVGEVMAYTLKVDEIVSY